MEGDTLNGIDMSKLYDGIIIGGGPAGLSAAIYLARAKYRVLVIEKEKMGGQITITSEVVNYPGVPETDGRRLTENMRQQAEFFGAEFIDVYKRQACGEFVFCRSCHKKEASQPGHSDHW